LIAGRIIVEAGSVRLGTAMKPLIAARGALSVARIHLLPASLAVHPAGVALQPSTLALQRPRLAIAFGGIVLASYDTGLLAGNAHDAVTRPILAESHEGE
jgi:hypothetical protein